MGRKINNEANVQGGFDTIEDMANWIKYIQDEAYEQGVKDKQKEIESSFDPLED